MENHSVFGSIETATPVRSTLAPQPGVASGADLLPDGLVARAKAGDRAALDKLLAAVRPRLYTVALRMMRDRDDAEDVVQDAMMKVCRHLPRFEERAALSTWLHRIVVNTALDRMRGQTGRPVRPGRRPEHRLAEDERPAPEAVDEETPEVLLGRAQIAGTVHGALAALSPAHRDVLALRELDGESYLSIAAHARCPVGTVMSRLHHARRKLTEQLTAGGAELLLAA